MAGHDAEAGELFALPDPHYASDVGYHRCHATRPVLPVHHGEGAIGEAERGVPNTRSVSEIYLSTLAKDVDVRSGSGL